ncbi:MAG: hypothetical protein JXQ26_04970 [Tissierellales bacterium]|jgi:hypothetical protein|nr:hypothetical protein [Tissierellales bacterium]MBN2827314.1 hypothetical protein [Tissierellales bacterium]
MIKFEFYGNLKTMRLITIVSFFLGVFLISFPSLIGLTLIRISGILLSVFSGFGVYMTEGTIWGKDRSFFLVGILTGILILFFPALVLIISGMGLLSFGIYKGFFIIRDRNFSSLYEIAMTLVILFLGIFMMFNGNAAIGSIVKIVGVIVISFSAILFYKTLES